MLQNLSEGEGVRRLLYFSGQGVPQAARLRMRRIAALVVLAFVVPSGANAEDLVGRASVVDGDTLEIRGEKIRLHGIDAPESSQRCTRPNGKEWRCGQKSANALSDKIGQRNVRCEGDKRDRWGRLIAVCFSGTQDLNAWLVRRGWAVAYRKYSKDYVPHEERARRAKAGVWSGTFDMPWEWRKAQRSRSHE